MAIIALFCLAISTTLCLAQLTEVEQNTILYPGPTCKDACASSSADGVFYLECGQCYLDNNLFDSPNSKGLQRFPLYELNFTKQPAIPAAQPVAYSEENPRFTGLLVGIANGAFGPFGDTEETNTLTICPLGKTVETAGPGECETRLIGVEFDLAGQCISNQGWITSLRTPSCEGAGPPAPTVSFNEPEQLAALYPLKRNMSSVGDIAKAEARAYLTNSTAAADSLWEVAQNSFLQGAWYKNVTAAEVPRMKELYGADWTPEFDALVAAGKLTQMDFTLYEGLVLTPNNSAWAVAAHGLSEYVPTFDADGNLQRVKMTVKAVRLSNAPESADPFESAVYTPEKSESAFNLAMLALRSALITTGIWPGHVYNYHQMQGAAAWALYNGIEPEFPSGVSKHPIREMLDYVMDPSYNPGFLAAVFSGFAKGLPATPVEGPYVPVLHEKYADNGPLGVNDPNTFLSTIPNEMARRSLLDAKLFTSPGGQPWDLYPLMGAQMRIYDMSLEYTTAVVNAYYPTDASVAKDAQVQRFAYLLTAPEGANLRNVTKSNKIATRAELAEVTAGLIYFGNAHGTEALQDWVLPRVASQAHLPQRIMIRALPDPQKEYQTWEIVAAAPDNKVMSRAGEFAMLFIGSTTISEPFVPQQQDPITGLVVGLGSEVSSNPQLLEEYPYLNPSYAGLPLTSEQAALALTPAGGIRIKYSIGENGAIVFSAFAIATILQFISLTLASRYNMI
ncbi:hypothetical protein Ndes2526B_g04167 [Nannochloris sp. 'desiccata']